MESSDALNSPAEHRWKVRIDTGGTFTDALAIDPSGVASRRKVLSSGRVRGRVRDGLVVLADGSAAPSLLSGAEVRGLPGDAPLGRLGEGGRLEPGVGLAADGDLVEVDPAMDAPRLAMHLLCGVPIGSPLPPIELRVATTRGTNALLTRSTGRVLLVTTNGFEDLPVIGDQSRPDLFDLDVRPPRLLPAATLGMPRHVDASGEGLDDVDLDRLLDRIEESAVAHGVDGVAVCLLHSWRDPSLELELADRLAARLPGLRISAGAAVSPEIRLVPRMRTTIADAALAPVIRRFLEDLGLGGVASRSRDVVLAMSSGGGLVDASELRPAETLLSGPAAGVVGAFEAARSIGAARFVGFDMGGTSTDVARADGRVDLKDGGRVGDAEVRIPSVDLHTVAAGGGSICRVVEGRLEVGPESAGADPGPACYGAGGPLTVTDVNLLLDRADPTRFGVPLDVPAARRA
ncbi:MAG: hydantoinase/oxoprolinase family protein, partial [Planctomycetota bacterium]|nr:hydantoinase/oxoprolinase family protein [Planctomycetota bacterium]